MEEITASFQSFSYIKKEKELSELFVKLEKLDKASIRPLRAINTKTFTDEDEQILSVIESEIMEIRKKIKELKNKI
jgi:hypothetical protein